MVVKVPLELHCVDKLADNAADGPIPEDAIGFEAIG